MPKHDRFGLFPVRSPLLRESLLFSFPPGTEMFQFPGFAPCITGYPINRVGCPIRKSADQLLFAHPRSLSQLITSFFASKSQGILRTPLFTFSRLIHLTHHCIKHIGLILYAFVLKLCFFQHVNELHLPVPLSRLKQLRIPFKLCRSLGIEPKTSL